MIMVLKFNPKKQFNKKFFIREGQKKEKNKEIVQVTNLKYCIKNILIENGSIDYKKVEN